MLSITARRPLRRRVPRNPLSRAAVNERAYRERRRRGAMVVKLVVSAVAIGDLVRLGWLREADRADRERVADGLVAFARRALASTRPAVRRR